MGALTSSCKMFYSVYFTFILTKHVHLTASVTRPVICSWSRELDVMDIQASMSGLLLHLHNHLHLINPPVLTLWTLLLVYFGSFLTTFYAFFSLLKREEKLCAQHVLQAYLVQCCQLQDKHGFRKKVFVVERPHTQPTNI